MNLTEMISNDEFKTRKAVLVASLGEQIFENPAALADLYDAALEVSAASCGALLKHAGHSVFLIFDAERSVQAISAGAAILAKIGGASCAAAVAYGNLVHFETADHGVDYLGAPLERAFTLARAANSGALFVDEAVILATAISDVESALNRRAETLLGERGEHQLAGLPGVTVAYELLWNEARVGLKKMREPLSSAASVGAAVNANKWVTGVVSSLGSKFGFITDRAGTPHYFQTRNLASAATLKRGSRVVFRALPALRGAKEPRAEDIFVLESEVQGVISRVNPAGWGFLKLQCENGLEHNLFMLGLGKGFAVGQAVRCRIGVNERGPMGHSAAALEQSIESEAFQVAQSFPATRQRVRATEAVAAD